MKKHNEDAAVREKQCLGQSNTLSDQDFDDLSKYTMWHYSNSFDPTFRQSFTCRVTMLLKITNKGFISMNMNYYLKKNKILEFFSNQMQVLFKWTVVTTCRCRNLNMG